MKEAWKKSVVYQIYPMSFMDSNGDGIGDLQGIISRLDYLKWLGIDYLWLSPVYDSPMDDNGYDIRDYYAIGAQFGTMAQMDELLQKAHQLGIKIIMDLVVNHTSDEHTWFVESKKSKNNPYRDYYIWRPSHNGKEPNNLGSWFSGPAWHLDPKTNEYYFHLFSKKQPDLNWKNEKVRKEIYKMMNFWLDKGIDGFRMDVIELVGKDPDQMITGNGPTLHPIIQEMHQACFVGRDHMNVGECGGATPEIAKLYTSPKRKELDLIFQMQHIGLDEVPGQGKWELKPLNLLDLKRVLSLWQKELHTDGWNSLFWSNHDQPRIVSRWGNDTTYRVESAKMLAILLHFMQGTPYIYQGEEIGMTNLPPLPLQAYLDVETQNMYKEKISQGWTHEKIMKGIYTKGRDNARSPMQWKNAPQGGFSTGKPWLPVNPNYSKINVEDALKDPQSILYTYQKLIQLRKDPRYLDNLIEGIYTLLLPDHPAIYAYTRSYKKQTLLVVCNFYEAPQTVSLEGKVKQVIISNYSNPSHDLKSLSLRPFEAIAFELE